MSEGERKFMLSRRQRVVIWVIIGLLTLWIGAYLVLRIGGAHPDPIRHLFLVVKWGPPEDEPNWKRYAPDYPTKRLVKDRPTVSISVPENALSWSVMFHPLQQAEFLTTGRRVYFIDHETHAETLRIHIGATADF